MGNAYFSFKQFTIHQDHCAMKVTTDACLFGAWVNSKAMAAEQILDIGAGTGLLSLMIAQGRSVEIDAVEIDEECYGQLCRNIKEAPFTHKINPIMGDVRLMESPKNYDLIISNPPFYEKQLRSTFAGVNLARHSEELTLEALFTQVIKLMKDDGRFYVLMPYFRKEECIAMALCHGLFPSCIALAKQSTMHEPFRVMFEFSALCSQTVTEEIAIKKNASAYTDAFNLLLKDYYLNF